MLTGLRRGELASLTASSLHLDATTPYLVLEAKHAKNRQQSEIPMRANLADDLQQWLQDRAGSQGTIQFPSNETHGDEPLFDVPKQLVKVLNRDLAAAGIAKIDDRGRTIDVHALRHSFGSLLSAGGVAPRTAQAAMRHSSIDLTMNVYTDPRVLDVAGALDALPALPLNQHPQDDHRQRATGTDDTTAQSLVAPTVAPKSGNWSKSETIADNSHHQRNAINKREHPRKQEVSAEKQRVAKGIRTPDLRNHNPAL